MKRFSILVIMMAAILATAHPAHAATRTWGGGSVAPDAGGDHNWNTATHWTGDTVPTSADVATFDATSTYAVTVGASNYDQAAGIFTGGSNMVLTTHIEVQNGSITA